VNLPASYATDIQRATGASFVIILAFDRAESKLHANSAGKDSLEEDAAKFLIPLLAAQFEKPDASDISEFKKENAMLWKQIADRDSSLDAKDAELASLRKYHEACCKENAGLLEQIGALEVVKCELLDGMAALTAERDKERASAAAMNEASERDDKALCDFMSLHKLSALGKTREECYAEITAVINYHRAEDERLMAERDKANGQCAALKKQVEGMEIGMNAMLEKRNAEQSDYLREIERLNQETAKLTDEILEIEKCVTQERILETGTVLERAAFAYDSLRTEREQWKDGFTAQAVEITELKKQRDEARQEVIAANKALLEEVEGPKREAEAITADYQATVEVLSKVNEKLKFGGKLEDFAAVVILCLQERLAEQTAKAKTEYNAGYASVMSSWHRNLKGKCYPKSHQIDGLAMYTTSLVQITEAFEEIAKIVGVKDGWMTYSDTPEVCKRVVESVKQLKDVSEQE
jgi:hypothetical protein